MKEIALYTLDIAQNSITARARHLDIALEEGPEAITLTIADDGTGMSPELLARVSDPFTTTRTTRKVGMGVPLFRYSAESAGGSFRIGSEEGRGTFVEAEYRISHVDRMPLGDFGGVALQLVTMNPQTDFLFTAADGERNGVLDTRQLREVLGDIPFTAPEVRAFLKDYIKENLTDIFGGRL